MSLIHISKEDYEKKANSSKSKEEAILLSSFKPNRKEKRTHKNEKAEEKAARMRISRGTDSKIKVDPLMKKFENGEIDYEEYQKRKLMQSTQSLSAKLKDIRIRHGMEKRKGKTRSLKKLHVKKLWYSNRSVFRTDSKNIRQYKK